MPQNLALVKPATMDEAMSGNTPTMATVRKYQGSEMAMGAVVTIIAEGAALLNIGKNLQAHQIEYLAEEIAREYYWLTLADLRYMMKQGIAGKYGEIYDRLDVQVVLGWLTKYVETRMEIAESKSQQKHVGKISDNAKPMPQWFADYAKRLFEKHNEPQQKSNFQPDAYFWEMVEQEWNEMQGDRPDLEKFKALRLAQTKAMLSR